MLKLVIARHGNTFDSGDVVLRVGARTDLPLSNSGQEQAKILGQYFHKQNTLFDCVYTSELKRTQQTAKIALTASHQSLEPIVEPRLNEIDYGIDDGKPESEVIERIGLESLQRWESDSIAPKEWLFSKEKTIEDIKNLSEKLVKNHQNSTILLVTSNGIARFFPYLLSNWQNFIKSQPLKLKTGAFSTFHYKNKEWHCINWNQSPKLLLSKVIG